MPVAGPMSMQLGCERASVQAQRFGITEQMVYKRKKRSVFGDRSHTAHPLQTGLTPAQETVVVVHLRRTLLLTALKPGE